MSFTSEQEAQLTAWGCPTQGPMWVNPGPSTPEHFFGAGPFKEGPHFPRQPHDVLAWLAVTRPDHAPFRMDSHTDGTWQCGSRDLHPYAEEAADPYAAVYALAERVCTPTEPPSL